MTKVTYIGRSAKKEVVTYFILFLFLFLFFMDFCKAFFGRFVTRGVQKHEKKNRKNLSGLITKNAGFFPPFFFPPLPRLFCSIFCLSRFWAFRNKGSSKTRLKKSRENLLSFQKKYLLTSLFFFFHGPPCI
jgi:hypothetical protein